MLNTGAIAPAIELPDSDMKLRTLAEFSGSWVVVYFYPEDDTPGCTIQANEFTDLIDDYTADGIQVLGISSNDCFSHQAFRQKYGLRVTLLADVEKEACNNYGVIQEKEKNGGAQAGHRTLHFRGRSGWQARLRGIWCHPQGPRAQDAGICQAARRRQLNRSPG